MASGYPGVNNCTEEAVDAILRQIDHAHAEVEAFKGSMVKRRAAEVDMLKAVEAFRDMIRHTMSHPSPERKNLLDVFGGDCHRIAHFRAVMHHTELSEGSAKDQRVADTDDACGDLEGILKDKGFDKALEKAKEEEETKARERAEVLERLEKERDEAKLSAEDEAKAKEALKKLEAERKVAEEQAAKAEEDRKNTARKAKEEEERQAKDAASEEDRKKLLEKFKAAEEAERKRLDALPTFEWKAAKKGDPVPERAVPGGATTTDHSIYVARDSKTGDLGKVNLDDKKLNNFWFRGSGKNEAGEVLVVPSEWTMDWKAIRKGEPLPDGVVLGGSTKTDGNIFVARVHDSHGIECGKLNTVDGTYGNAHNIWIHGSRFPYKEGDVLCIQRR